MQISSTGNSSTLLTGLGLMQTENKNTKTETTSEIPFEDVLNGNTTESKNKDDSSLNYYDENGLSSVNKFEFFANAMKNNTFEKQSTPPTHSLTEEQKEYLNSKYDIENMGVGINDDWMSLMGELVSMNVITRDEGLHTALTPFDLEEAANRRAQSRLSMGNLSYNGLSDGEDTFANPFEYLNFSIDTLAEKRDEWFKRLVEYDNIKNNNGKVDDEVYEYTKSHLNALDVNISSKKTVLSVIELLK